MWGWVDRVTVGPDAHPEDVRLPTAVLLDALQEVEPNLPKKLGVWVRTSDPHYPLEGEALLKLWQSVAPSEAVRSSGRQGRGHSAGLRLRGLVVPEEGPEKGEWRDRLIVVNQRTPRSTPGGKPRGRPVTIAVVPTQPLTVSSKRLPGLEGLGEKTVAVAGLGMIGGTVAIHLAMSGLGAIRLLDSDVVEAGNLVRQPYCLRDIGLQKPRALRRQILRSAPWCAVEPNNLVNQRVEQLRREALRQWLQGCDLLVCTTTDKQAELYISSVAAQVGVPMVGGWVGHGAWGGFAYRTEWGVSGCLTASKPATTRS